MKTNLNIALLFTLCSLLLCRAEAAAPVAVPLGSWGESLHGPARIAADSAGRFYATDPAKGEVTILNAFGQPTEVLSGFAGPLAIAVADDGRIYLSETQTGSVTIFDSQWNVISQLGAGPGEFILPSYIALASGTVYVCDSGANQIKVYADGQPPSSFGSFGTGDGQFDFPAGVFAGADGSVYVVDQNNDRVEVFSSGTFQRKFPLKLSGMSSKTGRSQGILGDSQGRLFIADTFQDQIKVFTTGGAVLGTIGSYGGGTGQLRSPASLALDPFGRLLVASVNNARIELIGLDTYKHFAAAPAVQTVAAGTDVNFTVGLSGTSPFTYRWRLNGYDLSDNGTISGASTPQLTIKGAATLNSGQYTVVVDGSNGAFTSPAATLTVVNPPKATIQPVAQNLLSGTSVTLTASAWGSDLSYQWQLNGVDIAGATGQSLMIDGVQPQDSGRYTVVITNVLGSVSAEVATLNVVTPPSKPYVFSLAQHPDSGMQLLFKIDPGFNYAIEASTDLVDWTQIATIVGDTVPVEFLDPDAIGLSKRYYRLRWAP